MRLFYALTFDNATYDRLSRLQSELEVLLEKGKKTHKANLHMTLSFLGEQPEEKVPILKRILEGLPSQSLQLAFNGLGYFDKPDGLIIYASCENTQALCKLQKVLVHSLKAEQIAISDSRFKPHVTLFRRARPKVFMQTDVFTFTSSRIDLMCSERVNGVLTYTPIASKFLQ